MLKYLLLAVLGVHFLFAQGPQLTPEWISGDGAQVADVPQTVWLSNGTALLYDTRKPEADRTIENFDPATRQHKPILNAPAAMASWKALLAGKDTPPGLPWPSSFTTDGSKAVYILAGDIFVLDLSRSQFTRITTTEAEEKDPEFSPDGQRLAFVRDNNLYVFDFATQKQIQLTNDGSATTLNGTLSWVYWEEIFGRKDIGYWWSPDSRSIAYLQTDESAVPESTFVDFEPVDPKIIHQRYPKPGERNPQVRIGIVSTTSSSRRWIQTPEHAEWILRVNWLPDSKQLSFETLNRLQTKLDLYFADTQSAAVHHILSEQDPQWVNVQDDLYFFQDKPQFLWASERDGFMHLYRYRLDGTLLNQVTRGDWAIASGGGNAYWVRKAIAGVDEKNGLVFFTALKDGSTQRNLYRVKLDGTDLRRLSPQGGTHRISMSLDTHYYFDTYSNISTLPSLTLHDAQGQLQDTVAQPRPELLPSGMQFGSLSTIPAQDGFPMPAQILKPRNFDPTHRYPVILHVYGGPSAPTVSDAWQQQTLFDNILAAEGYVMVAMDNRAATAISKTLENTLGANPAAGETADLVAGVRWLKSQSWVDPARVGVYGWSGGGTNTLNLMTRSHEFKAGIAGAPVTDWRFYDSKWAESLVKLPQGNAAVYDSTSLVKRAADLSGRLLIMYGTYDDNVHPQNELAFMNALIAAGKPYQVVLYPMRKHGFVDKEAKIHRDKASIAFWKDNL